MRHLLILLLIGAAACSDGTAPELVPTGIELDHASLSLDDGGTARVTATVLNRDGGAIAPLPRGLTLTWTSSAPAVVWVSEGLLTAVRPGTSTVTVEAGSVSRSLEVVVRQVPSAAAASGGDGQRGTVGTVLGDSLAVRVVDRHGQGVPGVAVSFRAGDGAGSVSAAASTASDGVARAAWTLGVRRGEQVATAEVPGLAAPISFRAVAAAAAPAAMRAVGGDAQTAPPGTRLTAPLVVQVSDAHGNPVPLAEVGWAVSSGGGSLAAAQTRTDSAGTAQTTWTLGASAGRQTVSATLGPVPAVVFGATAGNPGAPFIEDVSPALLTPGATVTLTGGNFAAAAADNAVTVAGVAATVISVAPSRLTVRVPAAASLPCEPTRAVPVTVSVEGRTGSRSHPLQVATERSLAVGQSMTLPAGDALRCNGLPQSGGRYLVSVHNTGTAVAGSAAFQIRGGTGAASTSRAATQPAPTASRAVASAALQSLVPATDPGHLATLEANRALLQRLSPAARSGSGASLSRSAAPLPAVGDTLSFRVPTLGASNFCSTYTEVRARAVYVGRHSVVFEDVAAPLSGQMDPTYQAVGQEYDGSMHEILLTNFGNPLAADALTDANGRIFMLFTRVVNDSQQNVAGFVFSGDLFRRAECASSDGGEIFYARVPTSLDAGFSGSRTREGWVRTMRATIIHEVKHLTSYAERLAANARTWEESWLEESTARVAEEIWVRGIFGYAHRQNVSYQQSLHCEVRPSTAACAGKPMVMLDHFGGLYDYSEAGGAYTPLGRTSSSDASFYGSGWSLVRWAVDQSSTSESAFLKALTRDPALSGVRNLEARTGLGFASMLADWSLALAADDRPGFVPGRPQLGFPSWNLRDLFVGMNRDFPSNWPSADPTFRRLPAASFSVDVAALRGGSAAVFELTADGSGAPVMELRGPAGTPMPAGLGVSIVRVQ